MEIQITVKAPNTELARRILENLHATAAELEAVTPMQAAATQQQLQEAAPFPQAQQAQGYTVPQDYAHTMAPQQPAYMQQPPAQPQQPAYMQPPVAPPVYGQQPPVAPPAPQQPAYMQQPPVQTQQPAYMQQPPQVSAPTGTMDYTHEQLGRAVAPFIDKAPANRQKVQDCLKSLGVESVTQLNTKELRAAYAVALRQLGVQI